MLKLTFVAFKIKSLTHNFSSHDVEVLEHNIANAPNMYLCTGISTKDKFPIVVGIFNNGERHDPQLKHFKAERIGSVKNINAEDKAVTYKYDYVDKEYRARHIDESVIEHNAVSWEFATISSALLALE